MNISTLILGILTFVQLNCENLFDCEHDSLKQDMEYMAGSPRHWTRNRYWNKLNNIGQEIISCGEDSAGWSLPDIVALCEVENDSVIYNLTKRSLLRKAGYEYLITQSSDLRGIDVALLYSPFSFAPISHCALHIEPLHDMRPTRDILYVSGRVVGGDTLHIFVVHAPSRYGGERSTRPHRMLVMERLCQSIDSIRSVCSSPNIIISGDFNDYGDTPSLGYLKKHGLYDVSESAKGNNGAKATYKYQGEWNSLDHIFVSDAMRSRLRKCCINDAPFLLEDDSKYGGKQPRRTYNGYKYNGGYSDHLPLIAKFNM